MTTEISLSEFTLALRTNWSFDLEAVRRSEKLSWPYLQIFVADDDADLEAWAFQDFGTDREDHTKGVVEVIL